jgi:hypothetical protein
VRTEWIDTLFALLLAAAIIASMQILGVTLIAAALVIPAITARLLTDSFSRMMLLPMVIGGFCGVAGDVFQLLPRCGQRRHHRAAAGGDLLRGAGDQRAAPESRAAAGAHACGIDWRSMPLPAPMQMK